MRPSDFALFLLQRTLGAVGSMKQRQFRRKLDSPREQQERLAEELIHSLSRTKYGQTFGILKSGESRDSFRAKVPLAEFKDLERWIDLQRDHPTEPILFNEPVTAYECTSGSGGAVKQIPYTRSLQKVFGQMATLWITDIAQNGPVLSSAKFFMSVSPALQKPADWAGSKDDRDYLPGPLRWILSRFLVAPEGLQKINNPDDYRKILFCHLIAESRLEFISIWNPTYLISLLEFGHRNWEDLEPALRAGIFDCAGQSWKFKPVQDPRAMAFARRDYARTWPELKFISAWSDAAAAPFARELEVLFPHTRLQAKGLLATEGPMTFPLLGFETPVPLVGDVLYEFLTDDGRCLWLDEVEQGRDYELVVSFRGGFTRYRIGDRIKIDGLAGNTPCFRFLGRASGVSDLVGEKLNEVFVRNALSELHSLKQVFWYLIPDATARPPHYTLVMESAQPGAATGDPISSVDPAEVDRLLRHAFHYDYARKLEQLSPVQVYRTSEARTAYEQILLARGMKWGDIKPSALISRPEDAGSLLALLQKR